MTDTRAPGAAVAPTATPSVAPERAELVLISLILVAAVAHLNLSVANVALPDIGKHFDASRSSRSLRGSTTSSDTTISGRRWLYGRS
jgi:MFS transporter, DHA2 family, multidrug resistance protein